jgi:CheY-like chemotaxis protein
MSLAKRILLVEDEILIALDIEETLHQLGHRVTTVTTNSEAMALLRSATFDLAVLDYHLKDGDTSDLAAYLSSIRTPFVVCSGSTGIEELGATFANAQFLAKPFSGDGLAAAVANASPQALN